MVGTSSRSFVGLGVKLPSVGLLPYSVNHLDRAIGFIDDIWSISFIVCPIANYYLTMFVHTKAFAMTVIAIKLAVVLIFINPLGTKGLM